MERYRNRDRYPNRDRLLQIDNFESDSDPDSDADPFRAGVGRLTQECQGAGKIPSLHMRYFMIKNNKPK